jgi:hypothetical protein
MRDVKMLSNKGIDKASVAKQICLSVCDVPFYPVIEDYRVEIDS